MKVRENKVEDQFNNIEPSKAFAYNIEPSKTFTYLGDLFMKIKYIQTKDGRAYNAIRLTDATPWYFSLNTEVSPKPDAEVRY